MAVAAIVLAGCTARGGASATPDPGTGTPATGGPSVSPSASPAATPTSAPLPLAVAVTADGTVRGSLGSYALDGRGSDSPWLPFDALPPLTAAAGGMLAIRFEDGTAIGAWSARFAAAQDRAGAAPSGLGGRDAGPPLEAIAVGPLPSGAWVLEVRLFRADGRGDGLTYWAVTVP